jgi:hypothetical protein
MAFDVIGEFPTLAPAPDPTAWLIDIGPFMDRFGSAMMPVLTSADANVQGYIKNLLARKWVDLKRTDLAQMLALISGAVPELTSGIIASILNTPVEDFENLALRKLYFS